MIFDALLDKNGKKNLRHDCNFEPREPYLVDNEDLIGRNLV